MAGSYPSYIDDTGLTPNSPSITAPSTGGGKGGFDLMQFLNSPAGAAMISAAGGAASAYGQGKQQDANRQLTAEEFAQQLAQRQRENAQQGAVQANAASPLGANQQFAGRNALLNAILPGTSNVNITPGDPAIAAAMPHSSGGLRLPEGGLSKELINGMYGPGATLESLSQHDKQLSAINPNQAQTNYRNLGFSGQQADPFMSSVDKYQTGQRDLAAGGTPQALQQALENDLVGQHVKAKDDDWLEANVPPPQGYHYHDGELSEDGSGFWHKFAKYGGIAGAGVATAMTGGAASPLLIAALGAGGGAAAGWGSGGGAKGALLGAAGGALPGVGAGILTRNLAQTGLNALNQPGQPRSPQQAMMANQPLQQALTNYRNPTMGGR